MVSGFVESTFSKAVFASPSALAAAFAAALSLLLAAGAAEAQAPVPLVPDGECGEIDASTCPHAPTGFADGGPSDGQIYVRWNPANTGAPALNWTVLYGPAGGHERNFATQTAPAGARAVTLSNLDKNTNYAVRVVPGRNGIAGAAGYAASVRAAPTPPVFESAAVGGSTLTLTFNEDLDTSSVPAPGDFFVTVGSARRNVASGGVSVSGATVTLTLASAVTAADTVMVRYTKGTNPLRDGRGHTVVTFTDQDVTNNTGKPPVLSDATVSWDRLTLSFDRALDPGSRPGGGSFLVWMDTYQRGAGVPTHQCRNPGSCWFQTRGKGTASVSGNTVTVELASPFVPPGARAGLTYVPPPANALRDTSGQVVKRQRWVNVQAVDDGTRPEFSNPAPVFSRATVNGTALTVTFHQELDTGSAPPASAFWVSSMYGGGIRIGTGTVRLSGRTATVTLDSAVRHDDDSVTVSYARPSGGNRLRSTGGSEAKSFSAKRLHNETPYAAPVFRAAGISPAGKFLTVNFTRALDESSEPPDSAFTVRATSPNGRTRTIRGVPGDTVNVSGSSVFVELASAVKPDETVTLSYRAPSANPLIDREGTAVESFSDVGVTNGPPRVRSVAIVSDPGGDRTYGRSDTVRVQVRFDAPVGVSTRGGTPRLKLDLNPREFGNRQDWRWANYERGGRSDTLIFAYEAGGSDRATSGIAVPANALELNGGRIVSFWFYGPAEVANLAHAGLGHDRNHMVDGRQGPPRFVSAAVNGATLTASFDRNLDTGSAPAPGDFFVTVDGARRNVAPGGVSISGATVTLTLASAVAYRDRVTVRYAKPSINLLRGADGYEVATFTDQGVTNETPAIWSATLTVQPIGPYRGCADGSSTESRKCTSALTNVSLRDANDSTRVIAIVIDNSEAFFPLTVDLNKAIPTDWTLHVGALEFAVEDAALSQGNKSATWSKPDLRWLVGQKVRLALTGPAGAGGGGAVGNSAPGFRSASVSGNKLKMTFDEPLDEGSTPPGGSFRVTTTPEGGANGNGPRRRRSAQGPGGIGGTGTASVDGAEVTVTLDRAVAPGARLTVSYVPPGENALRDPAGKAAAPFSRQPATNVAPAPAVTAVAVVSDPGDDDTYGAGEAIRVRLTFGETVTVDTAGGTPRMKIRMNLTWGEKWAAYEGGSGTNALTFAYTVRPVNATPHGVAVLANTLELDGGAIASAATGTAANLAHAGLDHDPEHKVDYRLSPPAADAAPAVAGVAVVSDAGDDDTYGSGEIIRVRLTFGEAVAVDTAGGTPRMKIRMNLTWGEKWAVYEGGSGTNALTFAYTVRPVNATPHGVAVLANTLELDGGAIASAATGTAANLAHAGLGHDPKHKVDWQLSPPGAVGTGADTTAPVPESATVNGRDVTVTFDEALAAAGADLHLSFTVTGGGVKQHPGRATVSGKTVTMRLGSGSPARAGQSYTIGYFGGGSLKDAAGNAVARFSGLAAENLTLPVLTVADARADEGADAGLDFVVTLDAAMPESITVDYATADGTATAGEDYTAASGTLTFAVGERTKTVRVAILDDAIDEGEETFLFRLSNAKGARIGDGEATGTIANADPLQKMWLSRFGRTVAGHVTDAVSDRLGTPLEGAQVTVGGQSVDLAQAENGAALAQALTGLARALGAREAPGPEGEGAPGEWLGERGAGWNDPAAASAPRSMTGRELLLGSAFHLSADGEGAGPGLAAWGRVTVGGFDGEAPADDGSVRIDGDVTTGILGADAEWKRLLAGVAVSLSEGEGTFAQPGVDSGTIESTMTTVSPYARLALTERVSAWGLAGFGTGDMTIVQAANDRGQPERVTRTDISMRLGAVGGRGALLEAGETGGMDLALKADAFWVGTESEAVSNEGSTTADASRVRLILEGSRAFETGGGGTFTPGLELGLRHDGGDAETGTGVELGGRLSWADPDSGLSVEARVRTLIAHEDSGYEEWGASGAVRLAPGASGRGLSLSLSPTWGVASSGVERLWSARDAQGLAPDGTFEPESRLDAELGYGLPAFGGGFTGTPNVGLGLSDAAREVRIGWRLTPAARGGSGFEVNLDATRREAAGNDAAPEHAVVLRGALRW